MNILAFAGSNSHLSINKQLVTYVGQQFGEHEVEILDLNDYEMPIYSHQREEKGGVPQHALDFAAKVDQADLLLISLAEHNGAYTAAFKNVFDWISRIPGRKAFGEKQIFLMSTATGPRGGQSVLEIAAKRFPFNGGNVVETFVLPHFKETFNIEKGILDPEKAQELQEKIEKVKSLFETLA